MPRYSEDFKEKVLQKMMSLNSQSVAQIISKTGIREPTLYTWKRKYQRERKVMSLDPSNPLKQTLNTISTSKEKNSVKELGWKRPSDTEKSTFE